MVSVLQYFPQQIYSMDPSISIEKQKTTLQLKYLLSLKDVASEEQTLSLINKLYPFSQSPLKKLPPLQLQQFQPEQQITHDLKKILSSYALIIMLGKVRARHNIYFVDEQHLVDDTIKEKLVYNFDEEETELVALSSPVVLLKVHKIWIRIARQELQRKNKDYVQQRLLKILFFQKLSFQQFSKVLKVGKLNSIGPGQTLVPELSIPYNMYIITQGQLSLRKKVKFTAQYEVWKELQLSLQKKNEFSEELFEYLVREPTLKTPIFEVTFEIGTLGQGSILCGTETLNQLPLGYSINASLKTKYVAIKYPDLYVLEQTRISQIRGWPTRSIDKKQLRRQYYYEKNWENYKEYLTKDQRLSELEAKTFDEMLRKEVNLSMKRYSYAAGKVGQGFIVDSPADMMNRVRYMAFRDS